MKHNFFSFVTFLGMCLLPTVTDAVPPEDSVQKITAPRKGTQKEDLSLLGAVREISKMYKVPISVESSYVNDDRSPIEYPNVSFGIQKGETLESALGRLCNATEGQYQWATIHGIFCIWPTGAGSKVESLLDVPITLDLQGVSTWHAFIELAKTVNESTPTDRYLHPNVTAQDEYLPPEALREEESISLNLVNVTAREAACAIMAASPLRMQFWYSNYFRPDIPSSRPKAEILLWVYDANYELVMSDKRRTTGMEMKVWHDEAKSAVPSPPTKPTTPATENQPNK